MKMFDIISGPDHKFQSWTWLLNFGQLAIARKHGCSFCRYIHNLIIEPWLNDIEYDTESLRSSGMLDRIESATALGIPRQPGAPRCQNASRRQGQPKLCCSVCSLAIGDTEGAYLCCATCLGYVPWGAGHMDSEHHCGICLRIAARYAMDAALRDERDDISKQLPQVALHVFINSEHQPSNVVQIRFKYSKSKGKYESHMLWLEALGLLPLDIPRARSLDRNYRSERALQQIKTWLEECDSHHACYSMTPRLPTRIIDVSSAGGPGEIRIVNSDGMSGQYMTLSCPSAGMTLFQQEFAQGQDLSRPFKLSLLPTAFQDAIELTRKLGVRYLWIQALCSRTGDIHTIFTREIFANSYLTISASLCDDICDSFLSHIPLSFAAQGYDEAQSHDQPCYLDITVPPNGAAPVDDDENRALTDGILKLRRLVSYDLSRDPISKDPTTYQHRLLSPRTLSFGRCISFHCHNGPKLDKATGDVSITSLEHHGITIWPMPLKAPKLVTDRLSLWQNVVRDYSAMPSCDGDTEHRLVGIAGAAERYANLTPYSTLAPESEAQVYMAGLWKEHFQQWLMWDVLDSSTAKRYSGPSWSWISLAGSVRYYVDYDMEYLCDFESYQCELSDEQCEFGGVRDARLIVKGTLGKTTRFLGRIGGTVEELMGNTEVGERRERALMGQFEAKQPRGRTMSLDTSDDGLAAIENTVDSRETEPACTDFAVLAQEEIFLLPVKLGRASDLTGRVWKSGLMLACNDDTFRRIGTFTLDHKRDAEDVAWEENISITLV